MGQQRTYHHEMRPDRDGDRVAEDDAKKRHPLRPRAEIVLSVLLFALLLFVSVRCVP